MANHKSAIKRIRSSERKRVRNSALRSRVRSTIKKARTLIAEGNVDDARLQTAAAISILDRAAGKGILHPNNAARRKGRLMKHLNALTHKAE